MDAVTPKFKWTEERIAYAAREWVAGASASELGAAMGVSRNAIIGKMKRQGVKTPNTRVVYNLVPKRTRARAFLPPAPPPPPAKAPDSPVESAEPIHRGLNILDLTETTCRWPEGDQQITFCGHLPKKDSPYCPYHHKQGHS